MTNVTEQTPFLNARRFPPPRLPSGHQSFLCVFCCEILDEPLQASCGDRACGSCVTLVKEQFRQLGKSTLNCPGCQTELEPSAFFPDKAALRELRTLRVTCPHSGCSWQGDYQSYYPGHLSDECVAAPLPCPWCGQSVPRNELPAHEGVCPNRPVTCPHCQMEVSITQLEDHIAACDMYPTPCQSCGKNVASKWMQNHLLEECSQAPRACPYRALGCTVQMVHEELQKTTASQHAENDPENDSDESPMARWNQDALLALQGELKLNVITSTGLTDRLQRVAGGFMDRAEAQAVESKPSNAEQMGEVIQILLGKRNADFKIFCRLLRDSNYSAWVDQLEKKAREFRGEPGQDFLKFQEQYSEVVRNQASITVRITKCTTIGPPRMGKTCFKHLLTGQEWDVEAGTTSTDVMEAPEWVECYSLEEGGAEKPWKLLSTEQQQGELIRAVNALIITGTHLTTTPDVSLTTTSGSDAQQSPDDTLTTASSSDAQHSFTPTSARPDSARKPFTVQQALEALAGAIEPKAVQNFLKDSAGKVLGETRLIHFVDTGGQSVYHDVHPVLITSPSVYLVVFSLYDLHKKSDKEQLQYFRSDLIQRPLRSIYTFGTKTPQEKHLQVSPEGPTILIVGTHLDKIPESDRKGLLSTLHKMISTEIGNKPYRQFVRYDTEGQSFWAVDNTLAGREQEEVVKKPFKYITALRLMVQNRSLEMSVDIPLPWMLLKVVMEGKGVHYCKYSELLEAACERGYVREASPEADLDSMLKLFHILSLFYHKVPKRYKKEDSLVFINPDCLYSVTSDFLMAARDKIKESCEERCQLQTAFKEMNDSQGSSKQGQDQAVAATEEDTEDSQGDIEEKQQQSQAATKDDICHEELAEGIMVGKETIFERMRDNMNTIEQEIETVVQKTERIMARLGPESTAVVLERLHAKLMEIGWQKYKLPSMECPDASSQEAKRQLFMCRLVNSLASSVRSMLHDPERKGDVLQVRKEVAKAIESMKAQCQRRSIDSCDMDQLLAILSDLRIVAQLNDSISLVIPAALPEVPHSMDIDGTVDPLLVTVVSQTVLQVCYLPSGLFCCLISELVTGLCWTVVPMGRTHVAFTHKDITGRVHVTEYKSYIKIDLESQAALAELSETCQTVREMIHESILSVYQNLLGDPTAGPTFEESLIWGFQCEEHPDDDTHIAAFYEDDDEVDCCAKCLYDMESFAVQGVKPEQLVWFSS